LFFLKKKNTLVINNGKFVITNLYSNIVFELYKILPKLVNHIPFNLNKPSFIGDDYNFGENFKFISVGPLEQHEVID